MCVKVFRLWWANRAAKEAWKEACRCAKLLLKRLVNIKVCKSLVKEVRKDQDVQNS